MDTAHAQGHSQIQSVRETIALKTHIPFKAGIHIEEDNACTLLATVIHCSRSYEQAAAEAQHSPRAVLY